MNDMTEKILIGLTVADINLESSIVWIIVIFINIYQLWLRQE